MIHFTLTNGQTALFRANEKVQVHEESFPRGSFVGKKTAQDIEVGDIIRWRGLPNAVEVQGVRTL